MLDYKGLSEEEVQKLIDKQIEWDKEVIDVFIPMIVRQRLFNHILKAL
jgi:hypothetical protein